MKNIKNKSIIVLLLTIIMLYLIIKDDFDDIASIISSVKIEWLVIAIFIFYLGLFIESISLKMIANQYNEKYTLVKAFRLNVITKFFNGITPLASGGQPLQVYELTKEKIKVADGTNIIVENFLVYQTALMLLTTIAFIFNIIFKVVSFNTTLFILFFLGYFFNIVMLLFSYVVGVSKKMSKKIVITIAKILAKIHIVKNKQKVISKLENICDEFSNGFEEMRKNKVIIIKGFFLQLIGITITFTSALFIFKALNIPSDVNILICIMLAVLIFISGSFVPIPGGTGGMEYCFYAFFGNFIMGANLKSSLILWRFVTYLFPVLIGGIIFNIRKKSKNI